MTLEDTPPSSPALELGNDGDDEEFIEVEEDDLVEILEGQAGPGNDSEDEDIGTPNDFDEPELGPSPERDDASMVFTKHRGSVFCCAIEPTEGNIALTGGQDDLALLWEISSGNVLLECEGHLDSVTQVKFNHDGSLFATGDMGGVIQVWRTSTHQKIWDYQLGDLMWLRWHHGTNVLLAGSHGSEVYMWKIPSGDCKIFTASGAPCENGHIMPDGKRAFVGYSDGKLKVLDLRQNTVIHTIVAEDTEENTPVPCIDAHTDNNLVLTSVNGRPLLVSSQQGKVLSTLGRQVQGEDKEEWIETVGFCPDKSVSVASYGSLNGYLFIWDLVHQAQRNVLKQEGAITHQIWEPEQPLVYTAGSDGIVRLFDLRAGAVQREWLGHRADVLEINRSPNGSFLLSASDDKTTRVFPLL